MRLNSLYIAIVSLSACVSTAVSAQVTNEEQGNGPVTMERIRSKSGWLKSDNAAGLIFNSASMSLVEASISREKGGYMNVGQGDKINSYGLKTESFKKLGDRLSFYGLLGYGYVTSGDRNWYGKYDPASTPMIMGDSMPGKYREELYSIRGGAGYALSEKIIIGASVDYDAAIVAKRRDARNKNNNMSLSVRPGVLFKGGVVNAGLNLRYDRTTEKVDHNRFGTSETVPLLYLFEGLWFYSSQPVSENVSSVTFYRGETFGGAAQLEFRITPEFSFHNQFSVGYGSMERYRQDKLQKLGSQDGIKYDYKGILSYTGRKTDHILELGFSLNDMYKYNNIQELELINQTSTTQIYRQYGKILKYKQNCKQYSADYTFYLKRDDWNSSWILNAGYRRYERESEYSLYPSLFSQNLYLQELSLGITKNFIFGRNFLDISLNGTAKGGGGDKLVEDIPEGLDMTNLNQRKDLMECEYAYLTAATYDCGGSLMMTHSFGKKNIAVYGGVSGKYLWVNNGQGIFKGTSENVWENDSVGFKDKDRFNIIGKLGIKF